MSDLTTAQRYVELLAAALGARGLEVAGKLPALTVRNPAVAGQDPYGKAMTPGLSQDILLHLDESRGWTWCWVWPAFRSAERDVPTPDPEVEPICPAADIDFAADRIAGVVRLAGDLPDA
jgi:hypothetical protein